MPRRAPAAFPLSVALLALAGAACSADVGPGRTSSPVAVVASASPTRSASPAPSPSAAPTATAIVFNGPAFVLLRSRQITAGARLNFQGQGFLPGEQAAVTIEDSHAAVEATLDAVTISKDGNLDEVSVNVPDGLGRGDHVVRVAGITSGRSAQAILTLLYVTPKITLDTYSAKSDHTFGFSGSGFTPGELVDVRLGGLGGSPLATVPSDAQGNVAAQDVPLPLIQAGDYLVYFVGEQSQTPVSMGFNVQGFSPWVVLHTYAAAPYSPMGFTGQDFVPGDQVEVYLGQRSGQPLIRLAADATGQFAVTGAFNLPDLSPGDHQLIFIGHKSAAEIVAKFVVLPFSPGLELTNYAGRPGTPIAFSGDGWARRETLRVSLGEGRGQVATFQTDETGAFTAAGGFRLPIGTVAGGVPITVRGEISHAEVTLWFQALELMPSAELTAYVGPPGTVVAFTGRSFAGGERVRVRLGDAGGPELASAVASDDGTIENVSSYPINGDWGEDVKFVLIGESSHTLATTDFKIANPDSLTPRVPTSLAPTPAASNQPPAVAPSTRPRD
jgi:hypothetical protein